MLPGEDRQQGTAGSVRHQGPLYAGGDGGSKSDGTGELKACDPGGSGIRGDAAARGGRGGHSGADDVGEAHALRRGDLLESGLEIIAADTSLVKVNIEVDKGTMLHKK